MEFYLATDDDGATYIYTAEPFRSKKIDGFANQEGTSYASTRWLAHDGTVSWSGREENRPGRTLLKHEQGQVTVKYQGITYTRRMPKAGEVLKMQTDPLAELWMEDTV